MLELIKTHKNDPLLRKHMEIHYSQPKGFVGRHICYLIYYDNIHYGSIVGGSATINLPGRNDFFNITKNDLNHIINNNFFHIEKVDGSYPVRNFSQLILKNFRYEIAKDWEDKYSDYVIGFETLVELPRSGEIYLQDKWTLIGQTKGCTCKRVGGNDPNEKWTGKRVWDYENLRPKLVFAKMRD